MISFKDFTDRVDRFKNRFLNTNLGIARKDMPQINSRNVDDFLKWLRKEHGISSRKVSMAVRDMNLTQNELNFDKVFDLLSKVSSVKLKKPVIVSQNDYIMDGHHRIAALAILDDSQKVPVFRVETDIRHLLEVVREYEKTETKAIHEADTSDHDAVNLLNKGNVEDFLTAVYMDSDYYDIETGRDL